MNAWLNLNIWPKGGLSQCIDSSREIILDFLPLLGYMLDSLIPSGVVSFTIHLLFQQELTHRFLITSPGPKVEIA